MSSVNDDDEIDESMIQIIGFKDIDNEDVSTEKSSTISHSVPGSIHTQPNQEGNQKKKYASRVVWENRVHPRLRHPASKRLDNLM